MAKTEENTRGTRQAQAKKDKTSEETHARSGSVWKVPNQAGLKFKLPRPGESAATRVDRVEPNQSKLKEKNLL